MDAVHCTVMATVAISRRVNGNDDMAAKHSASCSAIEFDTSIQVDEGGKTRERGKSYLILPRATDPVFRPSQFGPNKTNQCFCDVYAGDSSVLVCICILRCLHLMLAASRPARARRGTGDAGRRPVEVVSTCLPACLVTVPALMASLWVSFVR